MINVDLNQAEDIRPAEVFRLLRTRDWTFNAAGTRSEKKSFKNEKVILPAVGRFKSLFRLCCYLFRRS